MSIEKLADDAYFGLDAVSNSLLSKLSKCPAAINQDIEQTPAMLTGSLAHTLILDGSEEFYKRYAVAPICDKRTTIGKSTWQNFCDDNPGKIIITIDQLESVVGMAESVASHPACQDLLKTGQPELSVTWNEEVDGEVIPAKAKCDWLSITSHIDLKTCQDSSYSMFSKTIYNMGYAKQFGWYARGLRANGIFPEHHIIIAVESRFPFTVAVYELTEEVIDYGEGVAMDLLAKYAKIKDMKTLPSWNYAGITNIRLPQWLKEVE